MCQLNSRKALLHLAIFLATYLAMMICAALQLQGEGCYTLERVFAFFSIKASRLLQRACVRSRCYGNIARQVAERVLHNATLKKRRFATILTIAQHVTRCNGPCNLSRNGVARQVAWKIAPCNRAFNDRLTSFTVALSHEHGFHMQISALATYDTYNNCVVK